MTAALATWSVDDPSLNNATDAPVRNMLGWPGAIVADLVMQLLGLGAIAVLLALELVGLAARPHRRPRPGPAPHRALDHRVGRRDRGRERPAGDRPLAASDRPRRRHRAMRCSPPAKAVTGLSNGPASALLGFVFAGIAILSLTAACGFGFAEDPHASAASTRKTAAEWEEPEEASHDEPGWGIVSLGALAHGFMSLRAALRRWLAARRVRR